MRLDDVRGFVFDVDGSLVHRGPDFRARPLPGAVRVLETIRASGRPLVLFTNGSHMAPDTFARGLREDGLPVSADELLTPVCSALTHLARRHPGQPAMVFGSDATRERIAAAGVPLVDDESAKVVLVTHVDDVALAQLERAARAVAAGAPLLTASYQPGFWGADGLIFSRGAMVTAAIAKVAQAEPIVVGKPSTAAVDEVSLRLGIPSADVAVIGDDLWMDIALGKLGGSRTVLVRSGVSGSIDLDAVPAATGPTRWSTASRRCSRGCDRRPLDPSRRRPRDHPDRPVPGLPPRHARRRVRRLRRALALVGLRPRGILGRAVGLLRRAGARAVRAGARARARCRARSGSPVRG